MRWRHDGPPTAAVVAASHGSSVQCSISILLTHPATSAMYEKRMIRAKGFMGCSFLVECGNVQISNSQLDERLLRLLDDDRRGGDGAVQGHGGGPVEVERPIVPVLEPLRLRRDDGHRAGGVVPRNRVR